jgi:hypothetical protein
MRASNEPIDHSVDVCELPIFEGNAAYIHKPITVAVDRYDAVWLVGVVRRVNFSPMSVSDDTNAIAAGHILGVRVGRRDQRSRVFIGHFTVVAAVRVVPKSSAREKSSFSVLLSNASGSA